MEDVRLSKLKASLADAMTQWVNDNCESADWDGLDTYLSEYVTELMADSAFNVLLAQSDLTTYYQDNEMLKD